MGTMERGRPTASIEVKGDSDILPGQGACNESRESRDSDEEDCRSVLVRDYTSVCSNKQYMSFLNLLSLSGIEMCPEERLIILHQTAGTCKVTFNVRLGLINS
jgi:hypothetical protein